MPSASRRSFAASGLKPLESLRSNTRYIPACIRLIRRHQHFRGLIKKAGSAFQMLLRRMQKFNCRHSAALSPMMRAFSIRGNGMNGFPITLFSFELNDLISQRIQKCLMRDEHDNGMRKLFAKQFNDSRALTGSSPLVISSRSRTSGFAISARSSESR